MSKQQLLHLRSYFSISLKSFISWGIPFATRMPLIFMVLLRYYVISQQCVRSVKQIPLISMLFLIQIQLFLSWSLNLFRPTTQFMSQVFDRSPSPPELKSQRGKKTGVLMYKNLKITLVWMLLKQNVTAHIRKKLQQQPSSQHVSCSTTFQMHQNEFKFIWACSLSNLAERYWKISGIFSVLYFATH